MEFRSKIVMFMIVRAVEPVLGPLVSLLFDSNDYRLDDDNNNYLTYV